MLNNSLPVYMSMMPKCNDCSNYNLVSNNKINQKKIWKTVGVSSSEYMNNLSALTVYEKPYNSDHVNWNQMSDRAEPHVVPNVVPRRGHSGLSGTIIHSSRTQNRPGGTSTGGIGVDVKHGSYARYLARLKGKSVLKQQPETMNTRKISNMINNSNINGAFLYAKNNNIIGNKTQKYNIISSCVCNDN